MNKEENTNDKKLEKDYYRITELTHISDLRSLEELNKALPHVINLYRSKKKDKMWLIGQLKSIRQDITVISIKNQFLIEVHLISLIYSIHFEEEAEALTSLNVLKQVILEYLKGNYKFETEFMYF